MPADNQVSLIYPNKGAVSGDIHHDLLHFAVGNGIVGFFVTVAGLVHPVICNPTLSVLLKYVNITAVVL